MVGFISIILTIVYILIGWFVMTLVKEDWEDPSLYLAILWPFLLLLLGVFGLFYGVEKLAEKIKEKHHGH